MRRRLREQRRVREALLLDLGALVYELHRQGKRAPELLQQKAAELTDIDDEVRELEDGLKGATEAEAAGPATEDVDADEYAEDDEPPADEEHVDEPVLTEHEEPRA